MAYHNTSGHTLSKQGKICCGACCTFKRLLELGARTLTDDLFLKKSLRLFVASGESRSRIGTTRSQKSTERSSETTSSGYLTSFQHSLVRSARLLRISVRSTVF